LTWRSRRRSCNPTEALNQLTLEMQKLNETVNEMKDTEIQLDAEIFMEADEALNATLTDDLNPIQNTKDEELNKPKSEMQTFDTNITKMEDKDDEVDVEILMEAKEASEDAELTMKDDLNATQSMNAEEFKDDYAFEVGRLVDEGVNPTLAFLIIEFAGSLVTMLPEYLIHEYGLENNGCLDKAPDVSVKVLLLKDEASKITEDDCDVEFTDSAIDAP
jgi:hypothetical protein